MKQNMQRKLEQLAQRLDELNQTLSQEDITSKLDLYRALMREHAELAPLVEHYAQWQQAHADEQTARGMLDDPALRDFAADEARKARDRMAQLEAQLQTLLLPKDPDDARNISSKSALAPAVRKARCLRACCCGCICAMPNVSAGRSKFFLKVCLKRAVIKKSLRVLPGMARIRV